MKFLRIFFVFMLMIPFVLASVPVTFSDQGTGVRLKSSGDLIPSADIMVQIYDDLNDGDLIYSEIFIDGIIDGKWNLMLGSNPANPLRLEYGKRYYRDYSINGVDVDFRNSEGNVVERQLFVSAFGGVSGSGYFLGKTNSTYAADFVFENTSGYNAANEICSSEYFGSHLCSQFEIIGSIAMYNFLTMDSWTGAAWVTAGGAKYSPAETPANDCNGFTHGVAGGFLGTFWLFEKPNGGKSALGHCGNTFALACCG